LPNPPPPGGQDSESIAGPGQDFIFGPRFNVAAVAADKKVLPALAVTATFEAIRGEHPAFGKNGHVQRLEKFHLTDQPVTAAVPALATGAAADGKFPEQQRIAPFQDFRIGDAGVGHVGVNAGLAMPGRAGPGSAADGLVVAEARVAESEVVHASLGCCRHAEGFQDHIHHPLGGEHVAPHHGRLGGRRQQAARGNMDGDGDQAAVIERQIFFDQASQAIENGGSRNC
jgi:hypothetical protein